jgi:uncharacterized protein YyaL (SSP411 family)
VPSTKRRKPNRLANETSTYLLQHANNPVDWYPWSEEALTRAREEIKPILLSVGYSACHWCHVMEHESFEDEATAELMNELFVNIKVDREERPDIDEIYMKAVQLLTGHGGWPMTVFLTPDLKPFYAGTYFPPVDRHGMPSFRRLMASVHKAWKDQRENVLEGADEITERLSLFDQVPKGDTALNGAVMDQAIEHFSHLLDRTWGGFSPTGPKFPSCGIIDLALRRAMRADEPIKRLALEMINKNLDQMAYGGIHDHLGGGFARYCVDKHWTVPHFEKMLYDNALLCRNYLDGYLLSGRNLWRRVAADLLDFVLREMTAPEGPFYCSLDADSEGEEGKFYVWTPTEVKKELGEAGGKWFCEVFSITDGGNFEHGASVPRFSAELDELCRKFNLTEEEFWNKADPLREQLLAARGQRIRPGRDEKILTSWSSLMISAFASGYGVLRDERYLHSARKAAAFILDSMWKEGVLYRTYGRGQTKLKGYLDDYAYFLQALVDLAATDLDPRWLSSAIDLSDSLITQFHDTADGGFFYTSHDHEKLITRTRIFLDSSVPAPTSVAAFALLRLGVLTGREQYTRLAVDVMRLYGKAMEKTYFQFASLLSAVDFHLARKLEIAIIADGKKPDWSEMLMAVHSTYLPNAAMVVGEPQNGTQSLSPLLQSRALVDGKTTVYVCQNYTCDKPLTDVGAIKSRLEELSRAP